MGKPIDINKTNPKISGVNFYYNEFSYCYKFICRGFDPHSVIKQNIFATIILKKGIFKYNEILSVPCTVFILYVKLVLIYTCAHSTNVHFPKPQCHIARKNSRSFAEMIIKTLIL